MNLMDIIRYNSDRDRQNAQLSGENSGMIAMMQGGSQSQGSGPQDMQGGPQATQGGPQSMQGSGAGGPMELVKSYMQNKQMNSTASSDTEQKLAVAAQMGQLPDVLNRMPDSARKLMDRMQKNGALGLEDNMKLNGYLTAATRMVQEGQAQKAQQMQLVQEQMRTQAMQNDMASGQQLNAIADQRLASANQLTRGVGAGVMTPQAQQTALDYMQSPAGQLRAQGVKLTPDIATQMMNLQAREGWHDRNFTPNETTTPSGVPLLQISPRQWVVSPGAKAAAKPPAKPSQVEQYNQYVGLYKDAVGKGDVISAQAYANKLGFLDPMKAAAATDLPGMKPAAAAPAAAPSAGKYKSADDVKADFKAGKIDRPTALKILNTQFGM